MNFRPGHVDLAINVPLLSSLAIRTIALGLGLGDRFGGFRAAQGPSLEEMVPHAKKAVNCRESALPSAFSASHSCWPQPPW